MKITFSIQGGPYDGWWNKDPETTGLGGPEEALIYTERELRKLGHEVIIGSGGVREYPEPGSPDDIIVSWRNWRTLKEMKERGVLGKLYLSCHDVPVEPHWSPEATRYVDRVILLNEHHAKLYEAAGCPREKMFICSNGVDLSQFNQYQVRFNPHFPVEAIRECIERIPGKCIYFSHPHRGLHKLREYWPEIREAVPHATLHAFWWEEQFIKDYPANESFGIMPMRNLGHLELAREILSAEYLTYPSVFTPEIAPITCIKSQVGGAVPITVNCGGMAETILNGIATSHEQYIAKVIDILTGKIKFDREKMMREARSFYDWKHVALAWQEEFLS